MLLFAIFQTIGVITTLVIPYSIMVSTFIKLTLDSISICNHDMRAPPIIKSMIGAPTSLLNVISCIDSGLDFIRIMDKLKELRHCGATTTNCFMVMVSCILFKFSMIS